MRTITQAKEKVMNSEKPKLSDQLRHALRIKHYSYKTEKSYVNWVYRFVIFYKKKVLMKWGQQ